MPHIKIYSTGWCNFCKAEKRFLDTHHLKYDDVNIEADAEAEREMYQTSGQMGVPFTVITKDDGTKVSVLGFDQPRLAQVLGLS
jgi:glutaredoxin 3